MFRLPGAPGREGQAIDYQRSFEDAISRLRAERRYRTCANLERDVRRFPMARWRPEGRKNSPREVTFWCSNDYLGMGGHPEVIEASVSAARAHGAGASGARNILGTHNPIVEFADLHGKKAAIASTPGWISNLAAISTIAAPCLLTGKFDDPLRRRKTETKNASAKAKPPQRER